MVDEVHMLGDGHRGARLEGAISRFRRLNPLCRILALSATIGGLEAIRDWFGHLGKSVDLIESDYRFPPLHRVVIELDDSRPAASLTNLQVDVLIHL